MTSYSEDKDVLQLAAAGRQGLVDHSYSDALASFERATEIGGPALESDTDFLCDHARALCATGHIQEAISRTEVAISVAGIDPAQRANVLRMRAQARIVMRQFAGAEADLSEVVAICREQQHTPGTLTALRSLSSALAGMGRVSDAAVHLREAASQCREINGPVSEPRARAIEGYCAFVETHYRQAKDLFEEAARADAEGDSIDETVPYLLARTCIFTGDLEEARTHFSLLAENYRDAGARLSQACMYMYLGEVALEEGNLPVAERQAVDAERLLLAEALGEEEALYLRRVRALKVQVLSEMGDTETSMSFVDAARPDAGVDFGLVGRWPRSVIWRRLGRSFHLAGRLEEAEEAFSRAVGFGEELEEWEWARSTLAAAEFHLDCGHRVQARKELIASIDAFRRMGSEMFAEKARSVLTRLDSHSTPLADARRQLLLYEMLTELTAHLDLDLLLDRVVERFLSATQAERAIVALCGSEGASRIEVARSRNLPESRADEISKEIVLQVIEEKDSLHTDDALKDARFSALDAVSKYGIKSVLCVPMLHASEGVVGALYADSRERDHAFTAEDLAYLEAFANVASIAVTNARQHAHAKNRATVLQQEMEGRYRLGDLIGRSPAMQNVFRLLERAAEGDVAVLLTGETGTGKDLAARAIHYNSSRAHLLFVAQSCAILRGDLLQSELFGHRKGAFTGAVADRLGLFEAADGGTIFLDEIGDASPEVQVALLRVLETGEVRRLGESREFRVDVRVVAATNRNLEEAVAEGAFREDLYYRLKVLEIEMPSLRTRPEDIPLLAEYLVTRAAREAGKKIEGLSSAAVRSLIGRNWPGNVRELYNVLQRAAALAEDGSLIEISHVEDSASSLVVGGDTLKEHVKALEKRLIQEAMERCDGNVTRASAELGLSRYGLQKMLKRLRLRE